MTDYITLSGFKTRLRITTTDQDGRYLEHIAAASRRVDGIAHRSFAPHEGDATTRYYRPLDSGTVWIDDAYDITDVDVDDADNGTWSTPWTLATHYEVYPLNGIGPDGQTGWPTTVLRGVGALTFPTSSLRRGVVRVTAKWGWPAVPTAVQEATYLLANRLSYEVSVPGGVTAPNLDIGLPGSALRRPYTAEDLLAPYVRNDRTVGVAG